MGKRIGAFSGIIVGLASNIVTTAMVAVLERLICIGQW